MEIDLEDFSMIMGDQEEEEEQDPYTEKDYEYSALYNAIKDRDYTYEQFWNEKVWEEAGVVHITNKIYDTEIAPHKYGDKPWWVVFGRTPYDGIDEAVRNQTENFKEGHQKMENWIKKMMALKEMYGDEINVGFIDIHSDELIKEAF
mmetsp:Transcript_13093/g.9139  ORF Transcript_13093/g.9139 Transcript_13093/m.9139 type:complete len:147 (+) Transcript_13093:228-668(+)